jgi:hypothetical protein
MFSDLVCTYYTYLLLHFTTTLTYLYVYYSSVSLSDKILHYMRTTKNTYTRFMTIYSENKCIEIISNPYYFEYFL